MADALDVLSRIDADPMAREFLSSDMDPAAFARSVLEHGGAPGAASGCGAERDAPAPGADDGGSGVERVVLRLRSHRDALRSAIQQHVSAHRAQLLRSVTGVGGLSARSEALDGGVRSVGEQCRRVSSSVDAEFRRLKARTDKLHRVHRAGAVLKRLLRFLQALRRLNALEAAPTSPQGSDAAPGGASIQDVVERAAAIDALQSALEDDALRGIGAVEDARPRVGASGRRVRVDAGRMLDLGLGASEGGDVEVAGALQAFHNLNCLPDVVQELLRRSVERVRKAAKAFCAGGEGAAAVADAFFDEALRAFRVFRVCERKRDPLTHLPFLKVLLSSKAPFAAFRRQKPSPLPPLYDYVLFEVARALEAQCAAVREAAAEADDGAAKAMHSDNAHLLQQKAQAQRAALDAATSYPQIRDAMLAALRRLESATADAAGAASLASAAGAALGPRAFLQPLLGVSGDGDGDGDGGGGGGGGGGGVGVGVARQKAGAPGGVGHRAAERRVLVRSLDALRLSFGEALFSSCATPVRLMFPRSEGYAAMVPSAHDLRSFVGAVEGGLRGRSAEDAAFLAPQCVLKPAALFAERASRIVLKADDSADARRRRLLRADAPAGGHPYHLPADARHNLSLARLLCDAAEQLRGLPRRLEGGGGRTPPPEVEDASSRAAAALEAAARARVLDPLAEALGLDLGRRLAAMHAEAHAEGRPDAEMPPSAFSEDARRAVRAVAPALLRGWERPWPAPLRAALRRLGAGLLARYCEHLSLVRPLGERARLRALRDAADLRAALVEGGLLEAPREAGWPDAQVGGLRVLLLGEAPGAAPVLPSTALLHLFAGAPPAVPSPHAAAGLSPAAYLEGLRERARQRVGAARYDDLDAAHVLARERALAESLRDLVDRSLQRVGAAKGGAAERTRARAFLEKARASVEALVGEMEDRVRDTGELLPGAGRA